MKLYTDLAPYYDALLVDKPYEREVDFILEHINLRSGSLLDVTCGTGRHIEYFSPRFSCVGVDVSEEMVAIASERNPSQRFLVGDMRDNNTEEQFDVVCSLYNSINFFASFDDVERAVAAMSAQSKDYVIIDTLSTRLPYSGHKHFSAIVDGKRIEQHMHFRKTEPIVQAVSIIFDALGVLENVISEEIRLLEYSRDDLQYVMQQQGLVVKRYTNPYSGSDLFFGSKCF